MNEKNSQTNRRISFEEIVEDVVVALCVGTGLYDVTAEEVCAIAIRKLEEGLAEAKRQIAENPSFLDINFRFTPESEGVKMLGDLVAAHNSGVSASDVPERESTVVLTRGVKDWVSMIADEAGVDVDLDDLDAEQAANLLRKYDDYKVSLEEEMTANKEFLEDLVELLDDNEGGATASITKH